MSNEIIMTGFSGLDKVLGGLRPGTLNVISGRPAVGKTGLALNIAMNVAKTSGKAVLYYSLEMGRDEIVQRLLKSELTYSCETDAGESIKTILNGFEDLPIYIDECIDLTPKRLTERFDALLADKIEVGMVIVDYLELLNCDEESFELFPVISNDLSSRDRAKVVACMALKEFAVKYQIPVIVLAQVSKAADNRENHLPELADLRYEVTLWVESVVFIVRSAYYVDDPKSNADVVGRDRDAKLIVAKNSYGESDVSITVRWHIWTASFTDTDSEPQYLKQE